MQITENTKHTLVEVKKQFHEGEIQILDYLRKSQDFISSYEIAADTQLHGGVTIANNILFKLEKEGIAFRDRFDKWQLCKGRRKKLEETEEQDKNLIAKEKANNTNSPLLLLPSDNNNSDKTLSSSENDLKENTCSNERTPISTFQEGNTTLAKVADLKEYPLNGKIYTGNNFAYLFPKIKESQHIEPLIINPYGIVIGGNTRLKCAQKLTWSKVEVIVRHYKSELEEKQAFLRDNETRQKTTEEKVREGRLYKEIETIKARLRQSSSIDDGNMPSLELNSAQVTAKRNPQVRDLVAQKVGMKRDTYDKADKVVDKFDELIERGYYGVSEDLRTTLNKKSTNAAHNKVKKFKKIEKIMGKLDKNDPTYQELENILINEDIKAAIEFTERYNLEVKNRLNQIQVGDVVRIVTGTDKAYFGQWGVVISCSDSREFNCDVLIYQQELKGMYKIELNPIKLSEQQKKEALDLMHRLRALWIVLEHMPDEQPLRDFLKGISSRSTPTITEIENAALGAIEKHLINKTFDRS
ncbi:MAG: hypothetical protein QNJ54_01605 [Prochloraceae cyanobacterium]|nr:hypothetical protein [Prochloraceae cyanobacterium]